MVISSRMLPAATAALLAAGGGLFCSSVSMAFLPGVCAEDIGDDYYAQYNYNNYYRRDDDAYAYYNNNAADDDGDDAVANNGDDDAAAAGGDDNYANNADDGDDAAAAAGDDDAYAANGGGDDDDANSSASYWSGYSVLPRRCVTYNDEDVIVFSTYENGSNQCSGRPASTYTVPVSTYMSSYLNQLASESGYNYEAPDSAQYVDCILLDEGVYAKLGCSESSKFSIGVNIYVDDACTVVEESLSREDVEIDISDLPSVPFKDCQACDEAVSDDDQYMYNNNNQQDDDADAPLCSALWTYREECDKSCQRVGHIGFEVYNGWNMADKVLLTVLSVFGFAVLLGILRKRRYMSNKECLLEEAALSSAGLKQSHIVGVFFCVVVVIVVFGLLGIKSITWFLLLVLDTALFGYLMKLTVDSGMSVKIGNSRAVAGRTAVDVPTGEPADLGYNQWK
mmetsp:Transcript_35379/g.77489  ORF Transcript_35379/g.77489 Transcript_35379/m.77489 type:complete len:452 (-) Transcript_35379:172-1527(-)